MSVLLWVVSPAIYDNHTLGRHALSYIAPAAASRCTASEQQNFCAHKLAVILERYLEREPGLCSANLIAMQTCWDNVVDQASFAERLKAAEDFNKANRFRKRGIAVIPTKFGISFTTKFLNQAGSLVHVYTDGTVLVTHGGVEMGQGLHTKVAQVRCQGCKQYTCLVFHLCNSLVLLSGTCFSALEDMIFGAWLPGWYNVGASG